VPAPVTPGGNATVATTQEVAQPATAAPTVTTTTATAAPVKVGKGMNPPHGEPNHRCDIAVGAPLNSKPNTVSTPQTLTPQTAQYPTPNAAATKTAPGMNPPHGQPKHRCDIAVGAPLDSKPEPILKPVEPAKQAEPVKKDSASGI
jgi:hypothetical protein